MHPSVFTELLINLLTFLPFHWKLKLTSIRAIKNEVQRRHYVIFVGFGYKKSLGSSFFGAWADFHWNCERSFPHIKYRICFIGMWYASRNTWNIAWPIRGILMRVFTDNIIRSKLISRGITYNLWQQISKWTMNMRLFFTGEMCWLSFGLKLTLKWFGDNPTIPVW